MKLGDKLVVITGGSGGIGQAIATDALRAGARVVIVSNHTEHLRRTLEQLATVVSAPRVQAVECDVGNTDSVVNMCRTVIGQSGCPDVLVNCAGFATYRTFESTSLAEIEQLVNVNLLGAMRCTRVFLPDMLQRGSGAIVNMASIAGRMVITPNGTYSAAKHGLVAWSEALRHELRRFGVQVNVICPGRVETAFFDHETFRTRLARPETRQTTPVGAVARATLDAVRRDRFLTYVPNYLGLVVWLLNAVPPLARPVSARLLRSRIESLYASGLQPARSEFDGIESDV